MKKIIKIALPLIAISVAYKVALNKKSLNKKQLEVNNDLVLKMMEDTSLVTRLLHQLIK